MKMKTFLAALLAGTVLAGSAWGETIKAQPSESIQFASNRADVGWMDDAIRGLSAQGYSNGQIRDVFGTYGYRVDDSVVAGVLAGLMETGAGLEKGFVSLTGANQRGMNDYLISRGLGTIFDTGVARDIQNPGSVECSSTSISALLAVGGAVWSILTAGLATSKLQIAQQLQLLQANRCSGVTNDHLQVSNQNEAVMIDYMIRMLKGTDWSNEQAAANGILSMAQILMGSGQVYSTGEIAGDYETAYPTVYNTRMNNELIIQESGSMLDRQRQAQIAAQRQQAASATAIQARPARVAEIMAATKAAPGMTAAIQEQVKMGALQVEAVSALHADIIATERAKLNEMARQQQDKALEQRMFENAMAGWGECKRCGGATVGWEK